MAKKTINTVENKNNTEGINQPTNGGQYDLFMSAICGSLASFVFGKDNIRSPQDLYSLLGNKANNSNNDTIVNGFKESVNKLSKDFAQNVEKNVIKTNLSEKNISSLLEVFNANTLNSISESVSRGITGINDSIGDIYDILDDRLPSSNNTSENTQNSSINNFVEYVSNTEKQFSLLIQSLIEHQKNFNETLSNSLYKLENIDYKLRLDLNLNGNLDITSILEDISKIDSVKSVKNEDITSIKDSVNAILALYKVLSDINEKIVKSNVDISSIENNIKQLEKLRLNKLTDTLNNLFGSTTLEKEIKANIESISKGFEILLKVLSLNDIEKVVAISNKDMRLFKKQIKKIGNIYLTAINDLITTINNNNFPTLEKEVIESLKQTFSVINYVTSLGVDMKELRKLKNTLNYLNTIIEEDLINLLNTIKSDKVKVEINSIIRSKLFEKINIIFDNISDIYNHAPKYKDIFSLFVKLTLINGEMILIKSFINTLSSINDVGKAANTLKVINEKILTNLTVDSSLNLKDLFDNFASIYKSSRKIKFDDLKDSSIKLIDIIILFENVNINKDIDKVGVFCCGLSKALLYFALISPFVPLIKVGLVGLNWCIDNIIDVVNKLKDVDMSKIHNIMLDFTTIVAMSGAVLIAGTLFMSYIKIEDLIAFTVCLGGFISATVFAYNKSIKDINNTIEITKDFALLITVSAAVLIAGGLIMKSINIVDLLTFTGILGTFIFAICEAYNIPSAVGDSMKNAKEFALLVAVSGAILIAGGLIMKSINTGDLWGFILALGTFVFAICIAYSIPTLISKFTKGNFNPIQEAEQFALLVAVSGAILIAGGLFMKIINTGDLWGFILALGTFVFAICIAYSIPSMFGGTMENAKEFTLLVAVSGAILIAGSLFMKIINYSDLITFTLTLGGFIIAICLAYGFAGKMMKESHALPNAYALAVLTAVAGATLLIGGYLLMENPGLDVNVAIFCTILTAYVGAMGVIIWLLSKIGKSVWAGIAAIAGIVLVTYMAAKVIEEIKEVVGTGGEEYWMTILHGVGSITAILVAVAGLSVAAGFLATGPVAILFWTGLGALGVISVIAILAAQTVKNVASAMKDINSVKNFDVKGILTNIKDFIQIVDALEPLSDKAWMITKVSFAMTSMGIMMSTLSNAVENYASMTVPEFDANGHPTGKKIKLNNNHFTEAARNIGTIIKILGGAVVEAYNGKFINSKGLETNIECKTMFETNWYSSETIFGKVTRSMSTMGPMLLTLAEAVKDYASLTVPVYDKKGQKIGVRTLVDTDFINAAGNVSKIVTTLGGAVIETYEKAENNKNTKGMFDSTGWLGKGDSKFAKVTRALSAMGPMLSSISKSVKDYADLRVNVYDDNGKVTGTQAMTETDFTNAANHVKQVVSTLGNAVAKVYNDNPLMFMLNQNSNPMLKVAQACTEMGKMISSISEGVLSYANMEVPIWESDPTDKTGNTLIKTTRKKKVTDKDFEEAAGTIASVITTMGNGIMTAFNQHKEWFTGQTVKIKDGGLFGTDEYKETGSTLFDKVISGCSQMANLITTVGTSVLTFAGGEIPEIKNGKPTGKHLKIGETEIETAKSRVTSIFTAFGNILKTIAESELFEDVDEIESIKPAIDTMIALISQSGEAIQTFGKMDLSNVIDSSLNIDNISKSLMTIAKLHNLLFEDGEYVTGLFTKWTYKETFFNELDSHSNNDVKNLKNALTSLNSIVSQINKINTSLSTELNNSTILDTDKVQKMCKAFNSIKTEIDKLFSTNNEAESAASSSISNLFKGSDESETNKKFKLYLNSIDDFIDLGNKTNENTLFGWQQIGLGLMTINTIVSTISDENHTKLKEHVDSIDKYVTKINSLDMSKVNSLTSLVQALNLLSFKMGNIDNLTEALSQKLSSVLTELTNQLKEADKSINKAHKLQDARKKAIEESVNKIKEIMDQTLNVEISKKDENDSTASTGAGASAIQSGENKSSSSSTANPVAEIDSPAASYNRVEEQGKKAKQISGTSNVSTEVAKAITTVFGSGLKAKINNKEVILTT